MRYYGEDGRALLSAGADRALRYTSVVRDSRGYELSQGSSSAKSLIFVMLTTTRSGSIAKRATHLGIAPSSLKLPVITSIAYSTSRSKDWDDVVTTHEGESRGRTWSVEGKRVGKFTIVADAPVQVRFIFVVRIDDVLIVSCQTTAVTACGNFGLVGTTSGQVVLYNMQSGMKRKVFKIPLAGLNDSKGKQVTGIATDALNRVVVVSTLKGGLHVSTFTGVSKTVTDFCEQFFDFQTMKLVYSISVPASITAILLQRDNGLVALTCDDLTVRIVDIETRRVVRELTGFRGRVLDLVSPFTLSTGQPADLRDE